MILNEQQIVESQVGDYIRKNKLTKKQALSGTHFKALSDLSHGSDNAKRAIENVFNGKEKSINKKPSTSSKTPAKKPIKPSKKKPTTHDDDVDDDAFKARTKAEKDPMTTPSFSYRMWTIHYGAQNAAIKAISEKMKKAKVGEVNIKVTNSIADDDSRSIDLTKTNYVIGVHIIMNNSTISAMKKFAAFLFESTEYKDVLLEGLFDKGKAKVKNAVDAFRKELGVTAIKAYVAYFIGNRFADSIQNDMVYAGVNEAGKMKGRISFYIGIDASK